MKHMTAVGAAAILILITATPVGHADPKHALTNDSAKLIGTLPHGKTPGTAKQLAKFLIRQDRWNTGKEWQCLDQLWTHESGWRWKADNQTSSAYGIPQILGLNEKLTPAQQIQRGIKYIKHRYETPCGAWTHWKRKGYQEPDGSWHGGWY